MYLSTGQSNNHVGAETSHHKHTPNLVYDCVVYYYTSLIYLFLIYRVYKCQVVTVQMRPHHFTCLNKEGLLINNQIDITLFCYSKKYIRKFVIFICDILKEAVNLAL